MRFGQKVQHLVNQYNFELNTDTHPQMFDDRDRQSMITSQTGAL